MAKIVLGEKSCFAAIVPPQTSELQTASISLVGAQVGLMNIQPSLLVLGTPYGNSGTANRAILRKSCILSMSSNRHSARCCDFLRWSFVCSFGVPIVTQVGWPNPAVSLAFTAVSLKKSTLPPCFSVPKPCRYGRFSPDQRRSTNRARREFNMQSEAVPAPCVRCVTYQLLSESRARLCLRC